VRVVIKVTGKVFNKDSMKVIEDIASIILKRVAEGDRIAVVTGGGKTAREYISMGEELGLNKGLLDILGIEAARMNALLLASLLGDKAYTTIPSSIGDFMKAWSSGKVVVMGGLQPGQSTNAVAAAIAELIEADLLINATNVDGVYDKDPTKYPDARLLRKITITELEKILSDQDHAPGKYQLLDAIAIKIIKRSKLKVVFTNAYKPNNIEKIFEGEEIGTLVLPE
jgi:uridylate kinase